MAEIMVKHGDGKLFLGTEAFALSKDGLLSLGITHRLSCLMTKDEETAWLAFAAGAIPTPPALTFTAGEEGPVLEPEGLTESLRYGGSIVFGRSPMADEDAFAPYARELLSSAARFLDDALKAGGNVYVHCSQGVSRSPTVVSCSVDAACTHLPTPHHWPRLPVTRLRWSFQRTFSNTQVLWYLLGYHGMSLLAAATLVKNKRRKVLELLCPALFACRS